MYKILITVGDKQWFVNDEEGIPREWEDYDDVLEYFIKLCKKHPDWDFEIV